MSKGNKRPNRRQSATPHPALAEFLECRRLLAASPDEKAAAILAGPPFVPTKVDYFSPEIYAGKDYAPAAAPKKPVTDQQFVKLITTTLKKRFGKDRASIAAGVALFSDAALVAAIPDARLRAALATVKGTVGEPAIASYANGDFASVTFTTFVDGGIGKSQRAPGADKDLIIVNEAYQHEDLRILGAVLVHEALHDDTFIGNKEELANSAIETKLDGQLLLEFPKIASAKTELVQRTNTRLIARLNTRDNAGNLRLFESEGTVYPGSSEVLDSFGAVFTANVDAYIDTPGNPTLNAILSNLTGQPVTGANFDDTTIATLDTTQPFTPSEALKIAKALKLNTKPAKG